MHFHEFGHGPVNLLATGSQRKLVNAQLFVTEAKSDKGRILLALRTEK